MHYNSRSTDFSRIKFVVSFLGGSFFDSDAKSMKKLLFYTRLASQNARELLQRTKKNVRKFWHLNNASIAIWVTNNWTAQEALNNLLDRSYFGYACYSIEAAALGYYGKNHIDLSMHEVALLIGLLKGSSFYDPRRKQERALFRMNQVIRQLSIEWPTEYGDFEVAAKLPSNLLLHNKVGSRKAK